MCMQQQQQQQQQQKNSFTDSLQLGEYPALQSDFLNTKAIHSTWENFLKRKAGQEIKGGVNFIQFKLKLIQI